MEIAGSIGVQPPFRAMEQEWVFGAGWSPSSSGWDIRPRDDVSLDAAVRTLREMVAEEDGRSYEGVVAAYDPETGGLVVVTVRDGRVSRRTVRRPRLRTGSNVIDLATHRRRRISRAIS
jgi:hypothetical protein